jgi:thiol-disulfide isomerase/thioredoxin
MLVGTPTPDVRLSLLEGGAELLSRHRGKTVVLMFWATWCNASRPAIEEFNAFAKENSGRFTEFFAISVDKNSDEERLRERIQGKKLFALSHSFSGNENYDEAYLKFQIEEIPYFVAIDPHGQVVAVGNDVEDIRCAVTGESCSD